MPITAIVIDMNADMSKIWEHSLLIVLYILIILYFPFKACKGPHSLAVNKDYQHGIGENVINLRVGI